jgi:predicted ribosome quality control (RQC) complex YloA/Tae2 family protein
MALSAGEIGAVVREIAPVVTGGAVQKIFQPAPHVIVLEIRKPGRTVSLLLSADPLTARLHLLARKHPNPAVPPPFCQFLRAHIEGARIEGIEQPADDRIVRLRMTTRGGPLTLMAELTGRSADLIVLNHEEKILATLTDLHDQAGQPYHPPPGRTSTSYQAEAPPPSPSPPKQPFPISASIERRYQQREEELAHARLRQARLIEVRKAVKKTSRRLDGLRADLDKAGRYRDYNRYGELLKARLGTIAKGQDQATVQDYFDPALPELVIPLDPSKDAKGNMEDYFKKHRKYLAAEREIRPRLEATEKELAALRMEREAIERGAWEPEARIRQTPVQTPRRSQRQKPTGPFRRFISADGLPILVGRNARENEDLTYGLARSHDLWLHARGTPGSHVVVRLEKGAAPPAETLRDAAALALLYSDLKKSGKGDVIYTKRCYVRKVKGRTPGTVTVMHEKALFVELEPARLRRLKEMKGKFDA